MRVFVLGTGRCGTTTFFHACTHIENYKSLQEPTPTYRYFDYKTIIVDPHLTWILPLLPNTPDDLYVHLKRDKDKVVKSWLKRGPMLGPGRWMHLAHVHSLPFKDVCELHYDVMIGMIEKFTADRQSMTIDLSTVKTQWRWFWNKIGATGNYDKAIAEFNRKYNASPA